MTSEYAAPAADEADADAVESDASAYLIDVKPQEGYLGFTVRELIIAGVWLVAFALSFFPMVGTFLDDRASIWAMDGQWVLTIGVPTVGAFLIVLRRLSPEGIRRVGSLGIDQFASVAFSVGAVSWGVLLWQQMHLALAANLPVGLTWVPCAETVLALVLVVVTVFAPLIPGIREDFQGRRETLAHRNANPVRPVIAHPRPVAAAKVTGADEIDDAVDEQAGGGAEISSTGHAAGGLAGAAAIAGSAGYVPEQHRASFVVAGAEAEAASPGTVEDKAETTVIATGDALQVAPAEPIDASVEPEPTTDVVEDEDGIADPEDRIDEAEESAATADEEPAAPEVLTGDDAVTEVFGALIDPTGDTGTDLLSEAEASSDGAEHRTSTPSAAEAAQPFWALAPDVRPVHDDRGEIIFEIGPDAWILVLEDRQGAFVVRHDDGRVGYLHDTTDMTRG